MCCKREQKNLAVTELHAGLVFEPQGPLVESDFRVNVTDAFSFFRFSKIIDCVAFKLYPKGEKQSIVMYFLFDNISYFKC